MLRGDGDGRDVDRVSTSMIETLSTIVDRDWTARAGCLDWSCWRIAEHIAHDLLAYAAQVTSQAQVSVTRSTISVTALFGL